jgi:hypothetical protein
MAMGGERKASRLSLANRLAPVELPAVGLVTTFLTLLIGYRLPWEDAVATAFTVGADTYLWIAVSAGVVLLACDVLASKRKKLIFGFCVAFSVAAAAAGWVIGEAVMHI